MVALPPQVLLVLILFAGGYYVGEKAVEGIKKVDTVVAHAAKHTAHKACHVATLGHKCR